jgi:hypothetical protein
MVGAKQVKRLQLRKQALVLESALNRVALDAEWQKLQTATAWARSAGQRVQQFRPWLIWLAPVIGFLAARRSSRRPGPGLLSRLLGLVGLIRPLMEAWEGLKHTAESVKRET